MRRASELDRQRLNDLRRHIVRNIDEPGVVPGADTLQPVADVLEAAGDERGKIVQPACAWSAWSS